MCPAPKDGKHTGTVCGFSGSGNPIVKKETWHKRAVILVDNQGEISEGERVTFTLQQELLDHFQAALVGEGRTKVAKPEYNAPPNVSIHHDGKFGESVGDTRPEAASKTPPDEREFDPETHGAPEVSQDKRKRKYLRQDPNE